MFDNLVEGKIQDAQYNPAEARGELEKNLESSETVALGATVVAVGVAFIALIAISSSRRQGTLRTRRSSGRRQVHISAV